MMLEASSSSLMMIAQQFFQQQQQDHPPWRFDQDCNYELYDYEQEYEQDKSSSSCSSQQQQQKTDECSSSKFSAAVNTKLVEKDPLEEILDAGYFDTLLTPPKTPPQGDHLFVNHDDAATHLDSMIRHPSPPMDDWMESFMSELEATEVDLAEAPLVIPANQPANHEEDSPQSSADALISCYPPCTPDDIWREHFGLNLPTNQNGNRNHGNLPQTSCSSQNAEEEAVVQLLLAAMDDMDSKRPSGAASNLALLKSLANPSGDPMQRVAAHFGDALQLRLNRMMNPEEAAVAVEEAEMVAAYKFLDEACPYLKFAHLTANQALLDATEGSSKVHIVDFGTVRGVQWAALLQAFSGTSRSLRITGIPSPELGPDPAPAMLAAGRRLTDFARLLNVDFEFCPVLTPIDRLDASAIVGGGGDPGEAVGVNFVLQLAALPAAALRRALAVVHGLNPRIVTVAEFETNNGASARERLVNNVGFYAAVFGSIDASAAAANSPQTRVRDAERILLAREIRASLLMEEGGDFSPERRQQWQRCIDDAGLWSAALSNYATSQARLLLWLYSDDRNEKQNFTLSHGPGGCISLGWRGRSIVTVSAWHC